MRRLILLFLTLGVGACDLSPDPGPVGREPPPAAALLAPGRDTPLLEKLDAVMAEIELAIESEPARVLTAEAMTDQLLHAPRDVDWLATGYSVEARLRQIQAKADGIVAMLRRGASLAAVEAELALLRADVQDLRRQLQLPGGGPAPPTLETLLAQDPMQAAQARPGAAQATTPAGTSAATPTTPAAETPPAPEEPPTPPPAAPVGQPIGRPVPDGLD
jgi:hypothetical protein